MRAVWKKAVLLVVSHPLSIFKCNLWVRDWRENPIAKKMIKSFIPNALTILNKNGKCIMYI